MLEQLIKEVANLKKDLVKLELTKTQIELESIDLNSKETISKLTYQLRQKSEVYHKVCDDIEITKIVIENKHRLLSVTRELITAGIIPSYEAINTFIKECSND